VKAVLVAEVRPLEVTTRVSPEPLRLMERPEKVATPLTALSVNVPESLPEPEPRAIVIDAVDVVITVPDAFSTDTATEDIVAPCVPPTGWVVKTNLVAEP